MYIVLEQSHTWQNFMCKKVSKTLFLEREKKLSFSYQIMTIHFNRFYLRRTYLYSQDKNKNRFYWSNNIFKKQQKKYLKMQYNLYPKRDSWKLLSSPPLLFVFRCGLISEFISIENARISCISVNLMIW